MKYVRGGRDFVQSFLGNHTWLGIAPWCSVLLRLSSDRSPYLDTLVSLIVICFGFDGMNFKYITWNLALFILLLQNGVILCPRAKQIYNDNAGT